jgi:hypothetical protein
MSDAEMLVGSGGPSEKGISTESKRFVRKGPPFRRSDAQWLELFKKQRDSGLSLIEFCAPRGMSHTSFSAKRSKLMERYAISSFDDFDLSPDELIVRRLKADASEDLRAFRERRARGEAVVSASVDQPQCIRLIINHNAIVEIPSSVEPKWVAELVRLLGQS